jgi:hypothetical protein
MGFSLRPLPREGEAQQCRGFRDSLAKARATEQTTRLVALSSEGDGLKAGRLAS